MKKISLAAIYIITAVVVIFNMIMTVKSSVFFDINELPLGKPVSSLTSPLGDKSFDIYLISNNLGTAIRGSVSDKSGNKNVFWQTDIESIDAVWLSNDIIEINDIKLDVAHGGTYDSRRGISLFQEGSVDENIVKEIEENEQK